MPHIATGLASGALASLLFAPLPLEPKPTVTQLRPKVFNPQLAIAHGSGAVHAGQQRSLTVEISGLHGASEVHLYDFTPGCGFDQQPLVAGLGLFVQGSSLTGKYTTDGPDEPSVMAAAPGKIPASPRHAGIGVGADGVARISTQGVHEDADGIVGNRTGTPFFDPETASVVEHQRAVDWPDEAFVACQPKGRIVWKDAASGTWKAKNLDGVIQPLSSVMATSSVQPTSGAPWSLSRGERHVIEDTEVLKEALDPTMAGFGTCSGFSETPAGKHAVGVRTVGNDIAFKIRSGPAGTRCGFATEALKLPQGVVVEEVRLSIDEVGTKCRLGTEPTLPGDILTVMAALVAPSLMKALDRSEGMVLGSQPVTATGLQKTVDSGFWLDPRTPPGAGKRVGWHLVLPSYSGTIQCDATALNDHGITVRLDSIAYRSPPGVTID